MYSIFSARLLLSSPQRSRTRWLTLNGVLPNFDRAEGRDHDVNCDGSLQGKSAVQQSPCLFQMPISRTCTHPSIITQIIHAMQGKCPKVPQRDGMGWVGNFGGFYNASVVFQQLVLSEAHSWSAPSRAISIDRPSKEASSTNHVITASIIPPSWGGRRSGQTL